MLVAEEFQDLNPVMRKRLALSRLLSYVGRGDGITCRSWLSCVPGLLDFLGNKSVFKRCPHGYYSAFRRWCMLCHLDANRCSEWWIKQAALAWMVLSL